jgi:HD-like signal output (HDOD) protein
MFNLDNKKMSLVVSSFQIPVKPQILIEMQLLLDNVEPDIHSIAVLISNDVGLSSTTLKIINSPFYGMNRKISEIKQAVMMLGLKTISGLVTALLLKSSFQGNSCISLERFWDDSLDLANAMAFIGNKVKNEIPVDMLYTIGLFQNCGIPLLALKFDDYKEVLIEANSSGVNSIELEEKKYQTNHAVLGYYVASSWYLPQELCVLILRHHEINYLSNILGNKEQLAFAVLKAAEHLVERVKRHNVSPDWAEIKEAALNVLGLTSIDYDDLEDDFAELFESYMF